MSELTDEQKLRAKLLHGVARYVVESLETRDDLTPEARQELIGVQVVIGALIKHRLKEHIVH